MSCAVWVKPQGLRAGLPRDRAARVPSACGAGEHGCGNWRQNGNTAPMELIIARKRSKEPIILYNGYYWLFVLSSFLVVEIWDF